MLNAANENDQMEEDKQLRPYLLEAGPHPAPKSKHPAIQADPLAPVTLPILMYGRKTKQSEPYIHVG